ncbi:DUF881 domain-containing protein [Sediminibacillus massiliensis]|uniref:DUF881 domain-containing protein n=1 Tax=Sediminibacillus massiliensis TaxID=1926277 RepID=UPI000988545A|nr:DUF881 domain-containing protein [Sediminibacillus massiliensis]
MGLKGRHVVLSFVLLVSGFLIAFSYQQTKRESEVVQMSDQQWEKNYYYRQQLIEMEEKNKELQTELADKRQEIQNLEVELGSNEATLSDYVNRKKELQMFTGELPVTGPGVNITLKDADYIPSEENANQYIVHERHILRVVNELLSAGAEAVSINGQRIFKDSYISCVGPVISVDGVQYYAPFIVGAIGDQDVLFASVNMTNGLIDELTGDNIEVEIDKEAAIEMSSIHTGERG